MLFSGCQPSSEFPVGQFFAASSPPLPATDHDDKDDDKEEDEINEKYEDDEDNDDDFKDDNYNDYDV